MVEHFGPSNRWDRVLQGISHINAVVKSGVCVLGAVALLASCASNGPKTRPHHEQSDLVRPVAQVMTQAGNRYDIDTNQPQSVPVDNTAPVKAQYQKQLVNYTSEHPPGTIVVDPESRFLYLIKGEGKAIRYGVGVGKAGFEFSGSAHIGFKREWPRWTPTPEMIKRNPEHYGRWAQGMDGGEHNPLGARALYLVKNGKDTLYRIHGTNEPWTIGTAASSGCIRMLNQDVIDLYKQVPTGAKVVVLGADNKSI